jgi:CHAT domain-containing protein
MRVKTLALRGGSQDRHRAAYGGLLLLLAALLFAAWPAPGRAAATTQAAVAPQAQMQAGARAFTSGDFGEALRQWSLAASGYEKAGDRDGQARALLRGAEAELSLGRSPNALEKLHKAKALAEQSGEPSLLLRVDSGLGNAYVLTGRDADAERLLRASVERAGKLRDADTAAQALNNLGNLYAMQGRYRDAVRSYRDALDAANRAGKKDVAIRASNNLARAMMDEGRHGEAIPLLAVLAEDLRQQPPSHEKAYGLISLGRLYGRLLTAGIAPAAQWSQRSHAALNDALAVADRIQDARARSYALGYLGELYEQAKRYDEALQYAQQAIFAAQQANAPEVLYRWQWLSGRVLKAKGDTDGAILAYRHSIATLKSVRADLVAGGARTTFRESVGPVFFQLADLLLQRSGTLSDPKLIRQDLVDARSTVEVLKGAELQDYFQDDCVTALRARTTGIDRLASNTAALYPIVLQDRLELLLSMPDGIRRYTSPVGAETLTREIRQLRHLLEKRTTHQYLPHAEKLYDWVIRPIAADLEKAKIDTLVIVSDAALRTIPLGALYDGERFLVERYALATTPGLSLTDPQPIERGRATVMLNGLTESVQGFAPLPYVSQELQTVQQLYGGTVLENRSFTIPAMEKDLGENPYRIVHIASHGQFDSDVNKTFLLTYDGKLGMNKLEQILGLSRFRTRAVELLTLSACQTAAGDDRAALGLAGVAIKAGARSALATLWTVNDPASAELVADFYRVLQDPANSKAKALQQAQLGLLKDMRYRHPSYWSAFLLIGNWL